MIDLIIALMLSAIIAGLYFVYGALKIVWQSVESLAKGSPKDHTRWMMANDALKRIEDWLEYAYKSQSAEEQRNTVMDIIDEYAERVSKT